MRYESLQQASSLLGRTLGPGETLWLGLTNNLEDYHLFCSTVVLLIVFYPLACFPYFLLDILRIPFFEKYRLQPNAPRLSVAEHWKCLAAVLKIMLTTILPLQLLSFPFFKIAGITGALPLPSIPSLLLQLLVFFLVEDFGNYWIHRAMHEFPTLYKRIHYMHHEYTAPMSFAATYAHPIEVLVLGIPSFMGPAIVRCHVVTLWAWILLRQWEAIDTHSGYDFPWNPTNWIPFYGGADFHDYHHEVGGSSHCNFASVFTYCDWLYGTDKGYRYKRAVQKKLKQQASLKQE